MALPLFRIARPQHACVARQVGASLIEVLVTLVIVAIGLLGLVGLVVQSQRSQVESYERVQALVLLDDMVSRISANRAGSDWYVVDEPSVAEGNARFLGKGGSVPSRTCNSVVACLQAERDLQVWHELLLGTNERLGGTDAGAMIGARGCVTRLASKTYKVSVAWQGIADTGAPTDIGCGQGQYGSDARRRAVSAVVQIPSLN